MPNGPWVTVRTPSNSRLIAVPRSLASRAINEARAQYKLEPELVPELGSEIGSGHRLGPSSSRLVLEFERSSVTINMQ